MSIRAEFEKKFPVPPGIEWIDDNQEYRITSDDDYWFGHEGAREAARFVGAWKGWQAARTQSGQSAEPESAPSRDDLVQCLLATRGQSEGVAADAILSLFSATTPQPAQQGSVPEGWRERVAEMLKDAHCEGQRSATGRNPSPFRWVNSYAYAAAKEILAAPRPEGDGWIKCSERLPKLGQRVQLFSQGVIQHMMPLFDDSDDGVFWDFEVHDYNPPVDMSRDQWRPLPQPPQEGE